jgi:2-amino-4-hydroxy-6-hydroxymethyldihydropteridine diphosphokinase
VGVVTDFVVGLGSNLGSRAAFIDAAVALLRGAPDLAVGEVSPLYASEALEGLGPPYYNAAVRVETALAPHSLLDRLLEVERALGRVRTARFSPRTIDLDILWGEEEVRDPPRLVVPHPGLLERPFALAPLLDVAPALRARWGHVLRELGGAPPVARGPEVPLVPDAWDRAAAACMASLRVDEPRGGVWAEGVRSWIAPPTVLEADANAAPAPLEGGPGWRVTGMALGPEGGGAVRVFLPGMAAKS